jgi:hypothetical protein
LVPLHCLLKRASPQIMNLVISLDKLFCSVYLQPVREHFKKDSNAKDLLKRVKVCSFNLINISCLFLIAIIIRKSCLALNNEIFHYFGVWFWRLTESQGDADALLLSNWWMKGLMCGNWFEPLHSIKIAVWF